MDEVNLPSWSEISQASEGLQLTSTAATWENILARLARIESRLLEHERRAATTRPPLQPEPDPPDEATLYTAYRRQFNPYPAPQPQPYVPPRRTTVDPTAPNLTPQFHHQTYQNPPLQPPQTYPSYTGGPTTYSGYVGYKHRIPQPPDPAPPYGAPTYGIPRAQPQAQDPIQPAGRPPCTKQPATGWCPLMGDHRSAVPLQTDLIPPYRDCPMEVVVVHNEAIVVEEVQVTSCREVMLFNHKSCDGDEIPMVVPSGVGKVEKTKKSSPNSARKEEQVRGREEIECSLQMNASRIKILHTQIGLGNSMEDNASLELSNDSLHGRDVAKMNHRSTSLDADARLIPPCHDTPSTQLRVSPSWFDMSVVKARGRAYIVGKFVTRKQQLHVVGPMTTVVEALDILVEKRVTRFLMVDDDWKLVGVVSDYNWLAFDYISRSGKQDTNLFQVVHGTWSTFNGVEKLFSKTNGKVVGDVMTPFLLVVRETTNLVDAARGDVVLFGRGQRTMKDEHHEFDEVFHDSWISKPGCLSAHWFPP